MCLALSILYWFKTGFTVPLSIRLLLFVLSLIMWSIEMICESNVGFHNKYVRDNLKAAFLLFILSEVMFFLSYFWYHFNNIIVVASPLIMLDNHCYYLLINSFSVPLLNTLILLASAVMVTLAHYNIIKNKSIVFSLILSLMLVYMFTVLQLYEYNTSLLTIFDGIMGRIFFLLTGFHGIHVLISRIMLSVNLIQIVVFNINIINHTSFELSILYFHFVNVVWLFLYFWMYYWM